MEDVSIRRVVVGPVGTNCYLLFARGRKDCIVVDPGAQADKIRLRLDGRHVAAILFTHGHFDHIGAGRELAGPDTRVLIHPLDEPMLSDSRRNAGFVLMGKEVLGPKATDALEDGAEVEAAGIRLKVMHTPGHSQGSCCFLLGEDTILTGDTVMAMGIGRTDLYGGSDAAMRESLRRLDPYLRTRTILGGHG